MAQIRPKQVIHRKEDAHENEKNPELSRRMRILEHWPNNFEIWPFKVGLPTLGLMAGMTGAYINNTFRGSLFLGHYSRMSSYLGVTLVPMMTTIVIQGCSVGLQIIGQNTLECPVCLQVKSGALQVVTGILLPIFSAPTASLLTASAIKTGLYIPKIHKDPKGLLELLKEIYLPMKPKLLTIAAIQVIAAMGFTYAQQEFFYTKFLPVLDGKRKFYTKDDY